MKSKFPNVYTEGSLLGDYTANAESPLPCLLETDGVSPSASSITLSLQWHFVFSGQREEDRGDETGPLQFINENLISSISREVEINNSLPNC